MPRVIPASLVCFLLAASNAPASDAPLNDLQTRLNDALFTRTAPDNGERYGRAELDILFWANTKQLLTSPSRENAIQVLDEFIRRHGERAVRDPVQRAWLQRDLWALFDWSASSYDRSEAAAREPLQRRLAIVIKRLALSADEIDKLPDNYAEAESRLSDSLFPQRLFAPDSPWLEVGRNDGPSALEHTIAFDGRSVFRVFVKFPGGREQAQGYLKRLDEFVPALVYPDPREFSGPTSNLRDPMINPATPQFPANTQWALVRRLCVIDDRGQIHPTRLVESIQTRLYESVPDNKSTLDDLRRAQAVAEFQFDRAHAPALRAVAQGERDFQFVHFRSMGFDPFEGLKPAEWSRSAAIVRTETLRTCAVCHIQPGILSVQTYGAFGTAAHPLEGFTPEREADTTRMWKSRRFEWGLLQGLSRGQN